MATQSSPSTVTGAIPLTHTAIIEDAKGKPTISANVKVPELQPGTVLVKTQAVAIMPADYKMGPAFPAPGAVIGMDFVGHVVKPSNDRDHRFREGDIVCGAVPGSSPDSPGNGAFAEYVLAPVDLLCAVPAHVSPIDAVAMGTPLLTCSIALWSSLGLKGTPLAPATGEDAKVVLVYGGSSTCGTMAIQLLRLSGHDPVTTCSPRNFELAKSFGASSAFDYSTPEIGNIVRKHTNGKLRHALDCVTDKASARCCYEALGRPGGRYASLEYCAEDWRTRRVVEAELVMAIEAFGNTCNLNGPYYRPASPEKHKVCAELHQVYQKLLDAGQFKMHPVEVIGNSFEGILDGMARLKDGFVSGKRLVVDFSK